MQRVATGLLTALLVFCSACAEQVSFALGPESPVTIYYLSTKNERTLLPKTDAHRKLVEWVTANQSGWEQYLATPPAQGIIIRAPELNLQFMGKSVLVHTRTGVFSKAVSSNEYSFLVAEAGT